MPALPLEQLRPQLREDQGGEPEDLPRLREVLRRFFKGEVDYRLEFRARDAQGGYHWFDTRGSGLRDTGPARHQAAPHGCVGGCHMEGIGVQRVGVHALVMGGHAPCYLKTSLRTGQW